MVVVVVVISPPSIFTLRSLRLLASPVKSDGWRPSSFLLCVSLCVHYAFIMRSLCCAWGGAPVGLSNVVPAVGGRTPP